MSPSSARPKFLLAFNLMHELLNSVWNEVFRVLKNGRFACINVGDATRTVQNTFCLYPNHARILNYLLKIGFSALPDILWRKQANTPNKFMGSGMLPAGAYVTLEHEYILILRKGQKREFKTENEKKTDVKVHCFGKKGISGTRMYGQILREKNRNSRMVCQD